MKNRYLHLFLLALDGTPYSLLKELIAAGHMPNLAALAENSSFRPMQSVLPTVSSVAWASFLTGKNPARHGIFGFIERDPATMDVFVPTSQDLHGTTIMEELSRRNRRVFDMNIPITYPPRPVNGIQISGFLCPDIAKGTYPSETALHLREMDYRIDVNTVRARANLENFAAELSYTLEKRIEAMWYYRSREPWDFFLVHIMETDRLHHFMWELWKTGHPRWGAFFSGIYRRIDDLIGRIKNEKGENTELVILSDHGFCTLKQEVFLNKWLYDHKYLRFAGNHPPDSLHKMHPATSAYSLIPGRVYINLRGRERNGRVEPGLPYERLREELRERLAGLKDPQTGERMVEQVWSREEVYESKISEEGIRHQASGIRYSELGIGNSEIGRDDTGSDVEGHPPVSSRTRPQAADPGSRGAEVHELHELSRIDTNFPGSRIQDQRIKDQRIKDQGLRGLYGYVDFWDPQSPAYRAPDLIIEPQDGYDFKGNLWYPRLTEKGPINGTHTLHDAFLLSESLRLPDGEITIVDCYEAILRFFG